MEALPADPTTTLFGFIALAGFGYAVFKEFVTARLKTTAETSLREMIETLTADYERVQREREAAKENEAQLLQQLMALRLQMAEMIEQNTKLQLQHAEIRSEREALAREVHLLTEQVTVLGKKNDELRTIVMRAMQAGCQL